MFVIADRWTDNQDDYSDAPAAGVYTAHLPASRTDECIKSTDDVRPDALRGEKE